MTCIVSLRYLYDSFDMILIIVFMQIIQINTEWKCIILCRQTLLGPAWSTLITRDATFTSFKKKR